MIDTTLHNIVLLQVPNLLHNIKYYYMNSIDE